MSNYKTPEEIMDHDVRLQEINRRLDTLAVFLRQAEEDRAIDVQHAYMREIVRIGKEALDIINRREER